MRLQRLYSLRFIVLNTDHNIVWMTQNLAENTYAFNNFRCALTNGGVICSDIGLAFGGIHDQCVDGALVAGV